MTAEIVAYSRKTVAGEIVPPSGAGCFKRSSTQCWKSLTVKSANVCCANGRLISLLILIVSERAPRFFIVSVSLYRSKRVFRKIALDFLGAVSKINANSRASFFVLKDFDLRFLFSYH